MAVETLFGLIFDKIPDPRHESRTFYPLEEIFFLCFCATIANCDGWTDIEDYGKSKLDFLRRFLPYENGIPSDNTLGRLFSRIDPKAFQDCFVEFIKRIFPQAGDRLIAIDGKTSRGSGFDGCNALHTLSAYASETRLVLAQMATEEKSNEITAIPLLLDILDIKEATVTIDAMGCQKGIAKKIIDKKGHYVFGLKDNQKALRAQAEALFASAPSLADSFAEENHGHGRKERRICDVLPAEDVEFLRQTSEFPGFKSVVRVTSERAIKDATVREVRYYVSDLPPDAKRIAAAIRKHWGIENSLHYVLDVSFKEDASKIHKDHAPFNMAIIRHLAVNLIKSVQKKGESIRRLRKIAAYDEGVMLRIVNLEMN